MKQSIRASVGASIGNILEWYDFFIYGLGATLIFPALFFPQIDPAVGVIVGFASYAIGFIFRPLGALLFGHLGDIYGRKKVLSMSLLLMGACTVGIGLLPTYETIGIWATILLLVLRCVQGLALGGEWGSAATMAYEHAPTGKKGLSGSYVQVGVHVGILLSTAMFALIHAVFGEEAVMAYAWRIPFLVSIVMVFVGIYIRRHVHETPEFLDMKQKAKSPIVESFKTNWRPIIGVALSRTFQNTMFNMLSVYAITFLNKEMHYPKDQAYQSMMIASVASVFFVMLWGWMSDFVNRKTMTVAGCVSLMLFVPVFFMGLQTKDYWIITAVYVMAFMFQDVMYAIQASFIPSQFTPALRLTSSNIGYNLGGAMAGGLSILVPVIYSMSHSIVHVSLFLGSLGAMSMLGLFWLKE
jgi:MHS family shikimate/dehydroshikimate transporter-like MFS transporter